MCGILKHVMKIIHNLTLQMSWNFTIPLTSFLYNKFVWSTLSSREEDPKEIKHFHYMTCNGHALAQEPLPQRDTIYNFGRPFLLHHYFRSRKENFWRNNAFSAYEIYNFGRTFFGHYYYFPYLINLLPRLPK